MKLIKNVDRIEKKFDSYIRFRKAGNRMENIQIYKRIVISLRPKKSNYVL